MDGNVRRETDRCKGSALRHKTGSSLCKETWMNGGGRGARLERWDKGQLRRI